MNGVASDSSVPTGTASTAVVAEMVECVVAQGAKASLVARGDAEAVTDFQGCPGFLASLGILKAFKGL